MPNLWQQYGNILMVVGFFNKSKTLGNAGSPCVVVKNLEDALCYWRIPTMQLVRLSRSG